MLVLLNDLFDVSTSAKTVDENINCSQRIIFDSYALSE